MLGSHLLRTEIIFFREATNFDAFCDSFIAFKKGGKNWGNFSTLSRKDKMEAREGRKEDIKEKECVVKLKTKALKMEMGESCYGVVKETGRVIEIVKK